MSESHSQDNLKILDTLPDAVVCVDKTATIIYINPQAELLFDYTKGQLIGELIHVLVPEELRERHAKHFESYMQQPSMRPMNAAHPFKARRRDGDTFFAEINLSPLQTDGGTVVMAIIRRQKQHEA